MNVAERMRKYRARKALRSACDRAAAQGLDVAGIVREHLELRQSERALRAAMKSDEPVTPIGVTAEAGA